MLPMKFSCQRQLLSHAENPMLRNIFFVLFLSVPFLFLPFTNDPNVSLLLLVFCINSPVALFPGDVFLLLFFPPKTNRQNNTRLTAVKL